MDYSNVFLQYLQSERRYSYHTVQAYATDLAQFDQFCHAVGEDDTVCKNVLTIRSWIAFLMENHLSARSVNRKLTALRSYYKYLIREGHLVEDPMAVIQRPKMPKRLPEFVEEAQMNLLLEKVDFGEGFTAFRDRMIINILYNTGMRLGELIHLKDKDIRLPEMEIRVIGKRNKERIIPFSFELQKEVGAYIAIRNRTVGGTVSAFLVRENGQPLYEKLVYRVVNKYLRQVTTITQKSPHIIRHSFATHMLNHGADLNAIKELLGHASLAATQVYTHNSFEQLKKVYNQAHPRA